MKYKHEKSGIIYTLVDYALMKLGEDWVECVIYKSEHGNNFVREKTDFNNKFTLVKDD